MPAFHLPLPSGIVFDQIAPTHASHPLLSHRSSSSLFTPPVTVAPGVKRTRGGQPPQASTSNLTVPSLIEEDKGARRAVKGVPLNGSVRKSTGSGSSSSVEVRRSTRLSRDALSLSGGAGPASSSSSTTSKSREKQIQVNPRDKKRSKSGTGPSVLSDNGSVEAFSPRSRNSHSSSPAPSSPGASTIHPHYHRDSQPQLLASSLMEAGAQEAEDYVADMLRSFAMAACCAAQYESKKVIEALATLPIEQQRSWRCWIGVAKAHFEMLNYDKVSSLSSLPPSFLHITDISFKTIG
jgi:anaphase-promoting complex subunit 3